MLWLHASRARVPQAHTRVRRLGAGRTHLLLLRVLNEGVQRHELHKILLIERVTDDGLLAVVRARRDPFLLVLGVLQQLHLPEEVAPLVLALRRRVDCARLHQVKAAVGRRARLVYRRALRKLLGHDGVGDEEALIPARAWARREGAEAVHSVSGAEGRMLTHKQGPAARACAPSAVRAQTPNGARAQNASDGQCCDSRTREPECVEAHGGGAC
eukprot:6848706-Prymnesium_polylepis.1